MAAKRSKASSYPSRFGGGHVTIAQYITEYLCENIARSKRQELPQKFWEIEEWADFFKAQIVLLNRMVLPDIHPRAVVKALKDRRCWGITSFGGFLKVPKWKAVLVEHHYACLNQDEQESNLGVTDAPDATKHKPRIKPGKTSILSTLRDIDNGKEERETTSRRPSGDSGDGEQDNG